MKMEAFYAYWGKANSGSYHLLPYHCLDVAAVGWLLLDPEKPLCRKLAKQLDVDAKWLRSCFSYCLMIHDIGKFCRGFQNLVPNLSDELVPFELSRKYDYRHDSLGFALWQKELLKTLPDLFPDKKLQRKLSPWLEIVCGHHGKPPRKDIPTVRPCLNQKEDIPAAEAYVRTISDRWLPDLSPLSAIDKSAFSRVSWQLAGIAVLADWLGSDQSIFHYHSDKIPLTDYWDKKALPAARSVLRKAAFQPRTVNPFTSITQQFDFIQQPTPLQMFAQTIEINDSPHLFILEDVTGAGKTEAAMVLTHRLMGAGLADGLYVGLPTMATANGMYERLAKSYQTLFQGKHKPSLVLAHGASKLSDAFQASIELGQQAQDKSYQSDDRSASAYCNQWLADSRKKALLADVGVGTIDQALLAVLPARHQSLRILGLNNKVLLVDEVHAYDPYMRQLLACLLQAHAAQGGSAILLSATLPQQFRADLLSAYINGRGFESPALQDHENYPLVTFCNDSLLGEEPIETRSSVKRTVTVKRLDSPSDALNLIRQLSAAGLSVCWIRNTVKDARNAYQQLQHDGSIQDNKLSLFHSRFAMIDRQHIETDVLARFGKRSVGAERAGRVLIATQVVEQSLDLDFDVMISDLAPIDLIIQRAGRLQRHIRDNDGKVTGDKDHRSEPVLYILSPDPTKVVSDNWLRELLPGTQAVYGNPGQLWLTAKVLLENQCFSMPEDARHLIEGVYSADAQELIPEVLEQLSWEADAKNNVRRSMGNFNCLDLGKGYTLGSAKQNAWSEDVRIPTRLNETETTTVVLVKPGANGELEPWADSDNQAHRWPLSQISLPEQEWRKAEALIPSGWQEKAELLKSQNNSLKWVEVLPLVAETKHLYQPVGGWDLERNPGHEPN